MKTKEIIISILSIILPTVYFLIKQKNPDLPIDEQGFIEVTRYIVLAISGLAAGWSVKSMKG